MPKVTYTAQVEGVTGKLGGSILKRVKSGSILRRGQKGRQPQSAKQQQTRGLYNTFAGQWYALPTVTKDIWNKFASLLPKPLTGFNAYLSHNVRLLKANHVDLTAISTPAPLPSTPEHVQGIEAQPASGQNTITWTAPTSVDTWVQVFFAVEVGFSFKNKEKWSLVETVRADVGQVVHTNSYPAETSIVYRARSIDIYGRISPWTETLPKPTGWIEQAILAASDGVADDEFGYAVSIHGDYAIVGARQSRGSPEGPGKAYIYHRTAGAWNEQAILTASDGVSNDRFGSAVSIHGDYAIVGAWRSANPGALAGCAYIFIRTGTNWSQQAKLVPNDPTNNKNFGVSVSIYEDSVIIGAYGDSDGGIDTGAAYIFIRSGTNWSQQAKLQAPILTPYDDFGVSVSIYEDSAIVGAWWDDESALNAGAAYVFIRSGTNWSQQAKLLSSDPGASGFFGYSVSIFHNHALVGAYGEQGPGDLRGAAYMFIRSGVNWTLQAKLIQIDTGYTTRYGSAVSLYDTSAVVGARSAENEGDYEGAAYAFTKDGSAWPQDTKLLPSNATRFDQQGNSVGVFEQYAIMGAPNHSWTERYVGSATIFFHAL